MHQSIVLDSQIRDFVFIPLILMIFLIGILRYTGRDMLMGKTVKTPEPVIITKQQISNNAEADFEQIQKKIEGEGPDNSALLRSTRMREACHFIPSPSILKRKAYFCKADGGYFTKEVSNNPLQAMMNPDMMTGMLKGQFFMMAYNIGMFSIVGYFFSGFLSAKMPFPLAHSFRSMLQQGLNLSSLDVKYVSSLSWCFLWMYGLQGLQNLMTGTGSMEEEIKMMTGGMTPGGGQGGMPGQPKDFNKIFKGEIENYDILTHKFALENAEKQVLLQHRNSRNRL